jgi:hypothetical protein
MFGAACFNFCQAEELCQQTFDPDRRLVDACNEACCLLRFPARILPQFC